jgi:CheY-like chemotaxis protein
MYKVLIVDDEIAIRTMLQDYFETSYEISTAANANEALEAVDAGCFDLVISDINMPGMKGPELLTEARKRKPGTKVILMTAYNVDDYMRIAKEHAICNIVTKTVPFNFEEMGTLVHGVITGEVFGLERYLLPGYTIGREYTIRSSDDGVKVRCEAAEELSARFGNTQNIKLILDEIITNAIYHAPSALDGQPKYREYLPVSLAPEEYVFLKWGYDSEKYGVSVLDIQGRLTKETIMYKLDRHVRCEGTLDCSGRGIHMSRIFADRMLINIQPGRKTEVIIMNYFLPKYRGYRPLYINEL